MLNIGNSFSILLLNCYNYILQGRIGAEFVIKKIKDKLPGKWYFGISAFPDNGKDEEELINFAKEGLIKEISNSKQDTAETKEM
ncbi:hypothetical protein PQ689_13825 [Thermoanaerobacterium thermosaccharolyticum]|uniref:hypothetical protein n=1 Tax=Thermoanaerobacterium thermosaccharolyticum TaxID=1517 RepID=UPI003DAA406D